MWIKKCCYWELNENKLGTKEFHHRPYAKCMLRYLIGHVTIMVLKLFVIISSLGYYPCLTHWEPIENLRNPLGTFCEPTKKKKILLPLPPKEKQ
jgi:hypothetical protein